MKQILAACLCLALGGAGPARAQTDKGDKKDPSVPDGLKSLKHPDPTVRYNSAALLVQLGPVAKFAIPALHEALQDSDHGVIAVGHQKVHYLVANGRIVVGEENLGERLADFGIGGQGLQAFQGLEADAVHGVVGDGIEKGVADFVGLAPGFEKVNGFDANGGIVFMGGGEEELLDCLIVHAAGDGAAAGLVVGDLYDAILIGLDGADSGEEVVGGVHGGGGNVGKGGGPGAGEAGAEETESDQGQGADRRRHVADAVERDADGFEEQSPWAFPGLRQAGRAALDRGHEVAAAFGEQVRRKFGGTGVERRREVTLVFHFTGAGCAIVKVLLDLIFLFGDQFAVEVEGNQLSDRITIHTKSPNTARIFCVARKRQFLAASSVVPSISPIFRNLKPW